jgi:tryptophan synthase alpha chain
MIPVDKFPAIVPFVTCGWPSPEAFLATVDGLAQVGCPFFEVGFPFSDPIADGPTIQATSSEALENGIDLETCFELTAQATKRAGIPAVAMTYANLVFHPGLEEFCRRLKASGGEGLIVPDLSFEESGPVKEACHKHGLELVSFLAPTTASARRAEVAKVAEGFLYLVAVRGVTGGDSATGPELQQLIQDAKEHASCPVLVGFGVKEPNQVSDILRAGADGAIVGSALLEAVRQAGDDPEAVGRAVCDFLGPLVEATK